MDERTESPAGELSSDDKAYFESRGEKLPEQKGKPDEQAKAPEEAETDETEALLDDESVEKVEEKVEKVVPLRALTKEREESKKEKAARIEVEKKLAILEDRWNTILQLQTQAEQPPADQDPEPDASKDIFAHNAWLKRQLDKVTTGLSERDKQTQQIEQAKENEARVWNFWHQDAATYKGKNPEFEAATKWMSETRAKQLQALSDLHPAFKTEAGITQQIESELRDVVVAAAQAGISPAEYVFNMAKAWGFQGKAPDPAASEVARLAKDIDAETSLSGASGSRPGAGPTPKDIADMSPEQFEAWYTKHGAAGFKRLHQRGSA